MNRLTTAKRAAVVAALIEGCSVRSTCRLTGVAKGTVLKLLVELGEACVRFHDETVRDLTCRRIQADEAWCFCYSKAKNVPAEKRDTFGYGDVWTWVGIDADTKLAVSWLIGSRDGGAAFTFMSDIASRVRNRIQLSTDAHKPYLSAVEDAFGSGIDYATIQKIYGSDPANEKRYSPAVCIGCEAKVVTGDPDPAHINTSYVERQNLTLRMSMRRYTRLTNAFSKKVQNLAAAVAIHFVWYNFGRIHQTLRVTPAMEAGIASRVWTLADVVGLLEAAEPTAVQVAERRRDRRKSS